jgi:hypothetical protein
MKRIAALAALTIIMLAIPTAAMASTASSGPGPSSGPGSSSGPGTSFTYVTSAPGARLACPLPFWVRHGHVRFTIRGYLKRHLHGKPVRVRVICASLPARPLPKACRPQTLTFDMAAGAATMTEVSGPANLAPPQEFRYDGNTYTIMSVNPGADSFTVFLNGWRFVNHGAAITDATGYLACSS